MGLRKTHDKQFRVLRKEGSYLMILNVEKIRWYLVRDILPSSDYDDDD